MTSKRDIMAIAQALIQQASEASDDEGEDSTAESSTHLSQLQFDLYQDAQDPFAR
jgi:hypothetical protein